MYSQRDHRDVIAGGLLLVFGGLTIAYTLINLDLGTFRRMGPGMFPALVGLCIVILGVSIALPALRRPAETAIIVNLRAGLFVLGAILAFAIVLPLFGLIPGIVALAFVAGLADHKLSLRDTAYLSTGLIAIALGIFVFAFRIQVHIVSWP